MKKTISFAILLIILSCLIVVGRIVFGGGLWSISSLPFNIQQTVKLLMVIPIGLLVTTIFRNIIGINTFGTFTPILLALAFLETKLIWGLVIFLFVIIISIFAKWILDKLKILFISRLSVILTFVVTAMIILIFVSYRTGLEAISSITFFPIVIMIMILERFSIIQVESGTKNSLLLFLGTVVVASIGYLVMSSEIVQFFMLFFPELLLAILGLLILIGCYTGLRLTELWRFRPLERSPTLRVVDSERR